MQRNRAQTCRLTHGVKQRRPAIEMEKETERSGKRGLNIDRNKHIYRNKREMMHKIGIERYSKREKEKKGKKRD